MYTILVFGINALLIQGVQARPETNVNVMHNGKLGSRTIEAKEPGSGIFEKQDNGYGYKIGEVWEDDGDVNDGAYWPIEQFSKGGRGEKPDPFGLGPSLQAWARKVDSLKKGDGQKDGEEGEKKEDGEEGKKEPGGKHENFVEKKSVVDKLQDVLSGAGIKGPAQEEVIRGAIQQGILKEEQAPEGMARP